MSILCNEVLGTYEMAQGIREEIFEIKCNWEKLEMQKEEKLKDNFFNN